jgi:transposase
MTEALRENTRIDKGLKRGPRNKHKPRSDVADLGTWQIPAGLNPDEVLQEYLAAHKTSQIAKQYGLSRKALVRWLRQERPKEWKQVQIIRALTKKEDADEGIQDANDALSLARARELLKSGQWDLERLDDEYSVKQEVALTVDHHVTVSQGLETEITDLFNKIRGNQSQPIDITPIPIEDKKE